MAFLKDYCSFSRRERLGILFLCGCILLALGFRWALPYWVELRIPDIAAYEEEIAQFRKAVDEVYFVKNQSETSEQFLAPQLFYFDPNRATDDEWKKLGLNDRQIQNIRNYQAKGGQFKRKEDLQKLYTIPAAQYQLLEPYIRMGGNEQAAKPAASTVSEKRETIVRTATKLPERELIRIDLNTADSSLLTQLRGIGPVLASRTVRYRNRIGGFADVAQLGEVYGVSPELLEQLEPQLTADRSLIRKITVRTATLRELTNHPYLTEQQARGILNYRKLQTRIDNIDELVRNHILKPEEAEKIEPYLSFE